MMNGQVVGQVIMGGQVVGQVIMNGQVVGQVIGYDRFSAHARRASEDGRASHQAKRIIDNYD